MTGGTGVVGTALVRHLVGAGHEVRALARSAEAAGSLAAAGAEPVSGDVLDHAALVAAFGGCEVVYHSAGVNETCSSDTARMYRVNVDGSRAVLRASAAAGVRRLVYTSSAVAIGEARGVVATEKTPHRGYYLTAYERSKHHAERAVMSEKSPVEVVSVNPSSVQGPGRATGTGEIILRLLQGRLPALVESRVSLVDIDDCARGHVLAAERATPGERYLLSGFTTTVTGAVELAGQVLGRPVEVRLLPLWMARLGAGAVEAAARLRRRRPVLCREMVRVVGHGHAYDGSRATRDLGLAYATPADTIRRMVEWFQARGML
ncbi:MAG TPA: NAD-dependent epimerase/dehydratase family protein [Acidimicrobiia bacterium]|nr:NAD-dependent epimerase/dehydratase family protein [Acidimicrobiia bacterium]